MPLYISDDSDSLLFQLLGTIFASISYGIVIVLSGNCFHILQNKLDIYSNRMRILLLIYVTVMLLSSTWRIIGSICVVMDALAPLHASVFLFPSFGLPLTVTMWAGDGFMVRILIPRQEQRFTMQLQIWRCLVLYQDVSRGPRVGIIVLLSVISVASFGRPIYISTPPFKLLIKISSMRCHGVSRTNDVRCRAFVCQPSVHFTLCSRQYHTRSVDRFPTHFLPKTHPKYSWSGL